MVNSQSRTINARIVSLPLSAPSVARCAMDAPPVTPPDPEAMIADMWRQLLDAADQGDEQVRLFLRTFEPWAREQLARRAK